MTGRGFSDTKESMGDWFESTCKFSECKTYRYALRRTFANITRRSHAKYVAWIMLNPSTADESNNDPTIERCERYARRWGYDGIIIANLFALRSTDPKALYEHPDPIGPDNDLYIHSAALASDLLIAEWGVHSKLKKREETVLSLLRHDNLYALKVTKGGHPSHPLYLRSDLKPTLWRASDTRELEKS